MIDLRAFSDELQKIAARKRSKGAIYSPGIVAHEAGHAVVHSKKGVTPLRFGVPAAANLYGTGRLIGQALGTPGMGTAEFSAVSALANAPVLADEAASSAIALRGLKNDKKMTKKDWKRTALQLAAVQSSYLANPMVDVGIMAGAKAGVLHPAAQVGLKLLASPLLGKAMGALGMTVKGPKVNAKRAKEIVQATAPGTPVFAIKQPIPGGSAYIPPAGKSRLMRENIAMNFGGALTKKDLRLVQRKGGVLLAPLDAKTQAKSILPGQFELKTKFRRVT